MSAVPEFRVALRSDEVALTDAARAQLIELYGQVDDDDIEAIRIYVNGGGCSGMNYGMTFTDRKTELDKVLVCDGFDIYVDAVAVAYLRGVEIDYVVNSTGASFVFNNVFAETGGSGQCTACGAAQG